MVAGFHTEYSSMKFAMFFMAEYTNMIVASSIATTLFLGGFWAPLPFAPFTWIPGVCWFMAKVALLLFFYIWVRGTVPRLRYDQLMKFGWTFMLPASLANCALAGVLLLILGSAGAA